MLIARIKPLMHVRYTTGRQLCLVLRRLQEPSQAVSRATISRAVGLVSQAAPFGPCHLAAPRRAAQLPAVLQLEQLENWIGSQVGLGSHELSKKI
jgi:hypothetical protein